MTQRMFPNMKPNATVTVGMLEKTIAAMTGVLAENYRDLDAKLADGASPVEQSATMIADSILEDMRVFNNQVPVFDTGTGTPNPVVDLKWLK
jgi:hypothetical protein